MMKTNVMLTPFMLRPAGRALPVGNAADAVDVSIRDKWSLTPFIALRPVGRALPTGNAADAVDVSIRDKCCLTPFINRWKPWSVPNCFVQSIGVIFLVLLLSLTSACVKIYPGARQLAIDIGTEIKFQVCRIPFKAGSPCGERNVRTEADFGNAVYVYIYGVDDPMEMQLVTDAATKLRNKRDGRIPIRITFYADLSKSHEIKSIKIEGSRNAND